MYRKFLWLIPVVVLVLAAIYFVFFDNQTAELPVYDEKIEVEGDLYQLVFYDDFEGDKLNKNYWSLCPEQKRQDMDGSWDDSMISLDGKGNLVITSDILKGKPVSGAIRSKGKFEQARGYFEIRCRLQSVKGFWGAFWLMCGKESSIGNGAKDGAEIDIFESNNIIGQINHAIHWDGYGEHFQSISHSTMIPECYDGEFHKFALLWTDKEYIWYIDGKETYRLSEGDDKFPGSNEVPTYLKISSEFGSWAGVYDISELPDDILVDYVKVYKKFD